MYVEIGTNSRVPTTISMVHHVTKPISPLRGGTCLEIIPLVVETFNIPIRRTIIINQFMEGSERSNKE